MDYQHITGFFVGNTWYLHQEYLLIILYGIAVYRYVMNMIGATERDKGFYVRSCLKTFLLNLQVFKFKKSR